MRPKTEPKSNTWMVAIPFVLCFLGGFLYARFLQGQTGGRYDSLVAAGFLSVPFFAIALAQLRSGYLWCNLVPGNRGEHRSVRPGKFVVSTFAFLAIGAFFAAWCGWQFFSQGKQGGAPHRAGTSVTGSSSVVRGPEDS